LIRLLRDPSAPVRREAANALGRHGDPAAETPLLAALGDRDAFVDWSVRRAFRQIGAGDVPRLREALRDPARRESALRLCDEWWAVPVVKALVLASSDADEPRWRARLVATLAGLYRTYPEWTGQWWGPNPLAGESPRKTRDWDPAGMNAVLEGLSSRLGDPELSVRREVILGLIGAGRPGLDALRLAIDRERDASNLALIARALGELRDQPSVPALILLLRDEGRSEDVRVAALTSLEGLGAPAAVGARLELVRDPRAPAALAARTIGGLGTDDRLGTAELAQFLGRPDAAIRAAALRALAARHVRSARVREAIVVQLDDTSAAVRLAAIEAAGALRIREAVPGLSRLASDDVSRLAAIRALAALADPRAAGVYLSAIEDRDPEVRQAGERGLATIRDAADDELASWRRSGRLSRNAAAILERALERFVPLREWQIIGPFPRNTPRLFSDPSTIELARPIAGADGRGIRWVPRAADPSTGRISLDDLLDGTTGPSGHGYESGSSPDLLACGYVETVATVDRSAWMRVGSSGTITIDVNGQTVFHGDHSAGRAYAPDSDTVPIALQKGRNRILVRSRQGIGRWSFSVQISQPRDDEPLPPASRPSTRQELLAFALSHDGDPRRGERLFFDLGGVGCARCHSAGGRGAATIGPDLSGLALTYDRPEIVRSVLEPSSRIVNGYRPVVIALSDGTVATGLPRAESEDHVDLIDSGLRPLRLAKANVVARRLGDTSPMPTGLVDGLTPGEFADLIAFLESLRHEGSRSRRQ
jgi:putative heme-binding domain-containing protein